VVDLLWTSLALVLVLEGLCRWSRRACGATRSAA
jgi:uncharacterized protein YjeT (DUF2065 family)